MKEKILLIGGGGHCKACIDVIEQEGKYEIAGIIDIPEKIGNKILGYNIIGSDNEIEKLVKTHKNVMITVGQIKSSFVRSKLFNQAKKAGAVFPVVISPQAYVSKHSKIKQGTIIMHGVVVNPGSEIGENCIINNLSLIEHDVTIGNNTHISTGARINGNCSIGSDCFIGSGTIVNQSANIENQVLIASGSLVRKDIEQSGIYAGNPLKRYK